MYKRILIPLDGSRFAETALAEAKRLADKDTELLLFQVVHLPMPIMTPEMSAQVSVVDVDEMREEAEAYLDDLARALADEGLKASVYVVEDRNVANAITSYAASEGVELIVQSTHGRGGISRLVFGSVAEGVLRQTPCPILLVRARPEMDA
ncbi:MAG: universal stress protein [Caldilineales bacterium]|nr:universal stress protein [Caldilineales bacterium]